MKALIYEGPGEESWQDMPDPVLRPAPLDVPAHIEDLDSLFDAAGRNLGEVVDAAIMRSDCPVAVVT